jgi:S1-C subfamily serine protease
MRSHQTLRVGAYLAACLAVCVLIGMCGACVAFAQPAPEVRERGLTVAEETAATMYVYTTCADGDDAGGSGVLISSNRILTAAHVVVCSDGAPVSVYAGPTPTDMREVKVDRISLDADIARLKLETAFTDIRPASIWSSARVGGLICASTALPVRSWGCGNIAAITGAPGNGIEHTRATNYGNSGSGMYDGHGRLIGIVTECYTNKTGCDDTGGRATSVGDKGWLRP